jgi:hypothetical protein
MTIEELDELYAQANRLIMGRSITAAGKALVFSSSSLDATAKDIADLYELTEAEWVEFYPSDRGTALTKLQNTAAGLLGTGTSLDAKKAMSIAKTAIDGGRKIKAITALLKAGPSAAEAAAVGGQVASKATVWGWVATAAYAAGTGSWFAYNLRAFNLAAYEVRRVREGLEAHPAGPSLKDRTAAGLATVADVASDGAKVIGQGASVTADAVSHVATTAIKGATKGSGWLYGAAGGLFRRNPGRLAVGNAEGRVPSGVDQTSVADTTSRA